MATHSLGIDIRDTYEQKYGFKTATKSAYETDIGLFEKTIHEISDVKNEPQWLRKFRLEAYAHFIKRKLPTWGADLSGIDFGDIVYYAKPSNAQENSWEDVPSEIKDTFEKLGIPQAERKFLAGVGAQFESENVYHSLQKRLHQLGVVFVDPDMALNPNKERAKEMGLDWDKLQIAHSHFKKWFGKVVPKEDNKFASLNSATFSGGSFIYIPPNVDVDLPLQAYFRINKENMGQFERTLIIADEGSKLHYIEGCSAPQYRGKRHSLHTAVVEIVALKNAKVRYTTLQNWSNNVYNLVTKRAFAYEGAYVEWLDANIGSKITMKYPSIYLLGKDATGDILSVAYAGKGQMQDAGGKVVHIAPNTNSKIISKSVSKDGGKCSYRGLLHIGKNAHNAKSTVRCDALLVDSLSKTDTIPYNEINNDSATVTHEASVGKIGEDLIFYLRSRGLSEQQALGMIVNGFLEIFTKELPMEYAVEFNRLIQLEMAGSVG
ncbi:MAG TPA: Fe-S cluster assembly protein SufB [Candidatus Norongarragalinales archaeon]|nr:Fe-S cluster assembly protein SufB [Candidatus Norongarragalinales archaeon]